MKQYNFKFLLWYNGVLLLLLFFILFFFKEYIEEKNGLIHLFFVNAMFTLMLQMLATSFIRGMGRSGNWLDAAIYLVIPFITPLLFIIALYEQKSYPLTLNALVILPVIAYPLLVIGIYLFLNFLIFDKATTMITDVSRAKSSSLDLYFLVGLPGVGKTHWGKLWAQEYQLEFIDLDEYIEQTENKTIPEIFSDYGEEQFREIEKQCLEEIITLATKNTLIACGGGTPCFYDNMEFMNAHGITIYLEAEPAWLLNNLEKTHGTRPLLENMEDKLAYLTDLLQIRKLAYNQAHYNLLASNNALSIFAEIISR